MLFIQFLSLLYLMEIINSHTISKSNTDIIKKCEIFDSLNDLDYTTEHYSRHNRFFHKFRRDGKNKGTKHCVKGETKVHMTKELVSEKTTELKVPISTKKRSGGFWRKFKTKLKLNKVESNSKERRCLDHVRNILDIDYKVTLPVDYIEQTHYNTRNFEDYNTNYRTRNKRKRKKILHFGNEKEKREAIFSPTKGDTYIIKYIHDTQTNSGITKDKLDVPPYQDYSIKNRCDRNNITTRTYKPWTKTKDMSLLSDLTRKVSHLKQLYGVDKYRTSYLPVLNDQKVYTCTPKTEITKPTARVLTTESEYLGTAQIEALLNDIKVRAMEMVVENNPSVTDLITNTVTEATFEADPILRHLEIAPGFALTTFVSINNVGNVDKRTVELPNTYGSNYKDNVVISNVKSPHSIAARSLKEDSYTIAHNAEEVLQGHLKNTYKKLKNKISADFCKEVHQAKAIFQIQSSRLMHKITHSLKSVTKPTKLKSKPTNCSKPTIPKLKTTKAVRRTRGNSKTTRKHMKAIKHKSSPTSVGPTVDDYAMLTLYEQLLAKTHQDNVMKMLTTYNLPNKRKRDIIKLTKSNPETLADLSLRENIKKIYDDGEEMPDVYEYDNAEYAFPGVSTENDVSTEPISIDTNTQNQKNITITPTTDTNFEDTSYEGLSNKLSYKDYVNGYKHYLKFQKEQANQNFSNLVKYQAHKHHNVEDIGKFILNKIPQLPGKRSRRNFFDDNDIDDQDVSTKSDDSWFKKHFYFFMDNSPPIKYHTSETVAFKSPTTEPSKDAKIGFCNASNTDRHGLRHSHGREAARTILGDKETEVNLEELSKALDDSRSRSGVLPIHEPSAEKTLYNEIINKASQDMTNTGVKSKYYPPNFLNQFFSNKGRRNSKPIKKNKHDLRQKGNTNTYIESLLENKLERFKRSAKNKKNKKVYNHVQKEQYEPQKTTVPTNLFDEPAINPYEDTKKNKYAYVDIDVLPKPTAIVKLKEKESNNSKIKSFLNKFRKQKDKNNNSKKGKRECQRVERFSPFKKLKNMIKTRYDSKDLKPNVSVPDYDMMTSRIDTFKGIDYNKCLSIEDMKNQIPNITFDDLPNIIFSTKRKVKGKKTSLFNGTVKWNSNISDKDFPISMESIVKTTRCVSLFGSQPVQISSSAQTEPEPNNANQNTQDITNELMNVNNKSLSPGEELIMIEKYVTKIPQRTITDIKNEIDTLQDLSMASSYTRTTLRPVLPKYERIFEKKDIPSVINMKKLADKDLTIKAKLTRFAKLPLSNFKSKQDDLEINLLFDIPKLYEFIDDNNHLNIHEKSLLNKSEQKEIKYTKSDISRIKYANEHAARNKLDPKSVNNQKQMEVKKPYPDYFSDLLLWHSDILNSDKVPTWPNIFKNIQEENQYTTPNINHIMNELDRMQKNEDYGVNADMNSIRKLLVKLNQKANDSELITRNSKSKSTTFDYKVIQEVGFEPKFFPSHQPIKFSDKYMNSADFIKGLNKLYSLAKQPTANQDYFVTNAKNNAEYWNGNTDHGKGKYDKPSAIFLDTNPVSYDDKSFVTKTVSSKKLSKKSLQSTKHKKVINNKVKSSVAQINKPKQYFTTPLPMKRKDFEKFLKEENIDVPFVTSPLLGIPFSINRSLTKNVPGTINTPKITSKTPGRDTTTQIDRKRVEQTPNNKKNFQNVKTTAANTTKTQAINTKYKYAITKQRDEDPEQELKKNDKIENYLYNDYNFKDDKHKRYKRYTYYDLGKEKLLKNEIKRTTYGQFINEVNFFDKNQDYNKERNNLHNILKPTENQNEVEITIIDFDNKDQTLQHDKTTSMDLNVNTLMKDDEVTIETTETLSTTKLTPKPNFDRTSKSTILNNISKKIHNNLLYKSVFKENNRENTIASRKVKEKLFPNTKIKDVSKLMTHVKPDHLPNFSSIDQKIQSLEIPKEAFENLPNIQVGNHPKRVKISSHICKYDIFYHVPQRTGAGDRKKLSSLPRAKSQIFTDYWKGTSENSETHQILKLINAIKAVQHYICPSVMVHIDLPTYYMPNTEVMEPIISTTSKPWSDLILKYVSGIALLELLHKYGILKADDTNLNFTDGLDDDVNTKKVFSLGISSVRRSSVDSDDNTGKTRLARKANTRTKTTFNQQNKESIIYDLKNSPPKLNEPKQKEKRLFNLLPYIQKKLKSLAKNSTMKTIGRANTRPILKGPSKITGSKLIEYTTVAAIADVKKVETSEKERDEKEKAHEFDKDLDYHDNALKIIYTTGIQQKLNCSAEVSQKMKTKTKLSDYLQLLNKFDKRAIQTQDTFTAKDVAALEVIVDLMRNPLSYEEKAAFDGFSNNSFVNTENTIYTKTYDVGKTNFIQVHIAIPYDVSDKKRSLNPVRVRKVFTAKMSTPVNLEYQIHSYESDTYTSTGSNVEYPVEITEQYTTEFDNGLSPGMYLLVDNDKKLLEGNFSLKPLSNSFHLPNLHLRQVLTKPNTQKIGTSSSTKCSGKVTLSKDFIAAINKHLVQLYENLTAINEAAGRHVRNKKSVNKNHRGKRFLNWDKVKTFVGHERVCHCKCKPNKTMCRACAASDAVITELIFEFDNIAKYMNDHCTEIQTFFWMNPSGGKKLRDSIHRIDKSLHDYYKRVKGKCNGRTCKTFTTYIDKRDFAQHKIVYRDYIGWPLINNLDTLTTNFEKASKFLLYYDKTLKEKRNKLVDTINNCVFAKSFEKRSNLTNKQKCIRNVYSLDNINVNIICSPKPFGEMFPQTSMTRNNLDIETLKSENSEFINEVKKRNEKRKEIKHIFSNKDDRKSKIDKLFTYYVKQATPLPKFYIKRDIKYNQAAHPLLADTGGSFWYNYINKRNIFEPNTIKNKPDLEIAVIQSNNDDLTKMTALKSELMKTEQEINRLGKINPDNVYCTATPPKDNVVRRNDVPDLDRLNHNTNEILKVFGAHNYEKVKDMILDEVGTVTKSKNQTTCKSKRKKHKSKKTKKLHKVTKAKMHHKQKVNSTITNNKIPTTLPPTQTCNNPEIKNTSKSKSKNTCNDTLPTDDINNSNFTTETSIETATDQTIFKETIFMTPKKVYATKPMNRKSTTTKKNLLKKIKMATVDFLSNLGKRGILDSKTVASKTSRNMRLIRTSNLKFMDISMNKAPYNTLTSKANTLFYTNIISASTTETNPTILIIDNYYVKPTNNDIVPYENFNQINNANHRSLLLSIIDYKTNRLKDERQKFSDVRDVVDKVISEDEMNEIGQNLFDIKSAPYRTTKTQYPELNWDYEMLNSLTPKRMDLSSTTSGSLFRKIVNKLGNKIVPQLRMKKKAVTERHDILPESYQDEGATARRKCRKNKINNKQRTITEEICDSGTKCICDLQATFNHILDSYRKLAPNDFEILLKNLTCYKYKKAPQFFYIDPSKTNIQKGKPFTYRKWDWIRNKRSLITNNNEEAYDDYRLDNDKVSDPKCNHHKIGRVDVITNGAEFETFVKVEDNVYRIGKIRRKRTTSTLKGLDFELRNLPPIKPVPNAAYVMLGDSIALQCFSDSVTGSKIPESDLNQCLWKAERNDMLGHDNVVFDAKTVAIKNVQPKNVGNYICIKGDIVKRSINLSVIALPAFHIIVTPVYTVDDCTYDDLKALQSLGPVISEEICSDQCSVTVDEPVCLKDRTDGKAQIRATAIMTSRPYPQVKCSAQGRRDLLSSMALLCANNAPALTSIGVVISNDGTNKTLKPSKGTRRTIVTHTLRKKDSNGHHLYRKLSSTMAPGDVNVVVSCPAGYYLIISQKICATCPQNTNSREGDNKCSVCPRGTTSEPGADKCHVAQRRLRRYDWWWYPPCGYSLACGCVVCGCGVCVALAALGHVTSRFRPGDRTGPSAQKDKRVAQAQSPRSRPLSPSRVILARFFKPSLTSSRATDSQETKFELWKEKNIPPPLPPIDFDF